MVHSDGPQCADTDRRGSTESAAGQRFLIGDASLGWNPSSPAPLEFLLADQRLLTRSFSKNRGGPQQWSTRGSNGVRSVLAAAWSYMVFSLPMACGACRLPYLGRAYCEPENAGLPVRSAPGPRSQGGPGEPYDPVYPVQNEKPGGRTGAAMDRRRPLASRSPPCGNRR